VTNPIAEFHSRFGLLLKADVDGMELIVAIHQSAVGAAPDDISSELEVQHLGVALIMTSLETGGKLLHDKPGLSIHNSDGRVIGHNPALKKTWTQDVR
jgi:hypothetical protein